MTARFYSNGNGNMRTLTGTGRVERMEMGTATIGSLTAAIVALSGTVAAIVKGISDRRTLDRELGTLGASLAAEVEARRAMETNHTKDMAELKGSTKEAIESERRARQEAEQRAERLASEREARIIDEIRRSETRMEKLTDTLFDKDEQQRVAFEEMGKEFAKLQGALYQTVNDRRKDGA